MQIRTLTGSSISSALSEARSIWGDAVVMLQAEPPSEGRQARITVGITESVPAMVSSQGTAIAGHVPETAGQPLAPLPGSLRRPERATGRMLLGQSSDLGSTVGSTRQARTHREPRADDRIESAIGYFEHISRSDATKEPSGQEDQESATNGVMPLQLSDVLELVPRSNPTETPLDAAFLLKPSAPDRDAGTPLGLGGTESLPDNLRPSPVPPPSVTPAGPPTQVDERFGVLVMAGLRPTRANRLCREVDQRLGWDGLARRLAEDLPEAASGKPAGRILFCGEAGSGKTSLVLRSALSRLRSGSEAPAVVVVSPDDAEFRVWQDPTSLLEGFGLEVVRCTRGALASALAGLKGDVLVDAPAGFDLPQGLRLHRRLVLDARSSGSATAREGQAADSVIVTHLDNTNSWGFAAERLIAIGLPVAAMISSSRPGEGAQHYTPARFAKGICHA